MTHYIDADKLIAEIERRLKIVEPHKDTFESAAASRQELIWMKDFIASLQQEQPDLPGIEKSGIPGKDYIPVEWVDACEMYGKWKIVKQEQPEVELEKELDKYLRGEFKQTAGGNFNNYIQVARHFYELGKNTTKEE